MQSPRFTNTFLLLTLSLYDTRLVFISAISKRKHRVPRNYEFRVGEGRGYCRAMQSR